METGGSDKTVLEGFGWIFPWLWILILSGWGGTVNYFHHVTKHKLKFSAIRLTIDLSTSAFVGVLTYLLCREAGIHDGVTAAMVGISGHMGTRALFLLEQKYEKLFGANSGAAINPDKEP